MTQTDRNHFRRSGVRSAILVAAAAFGCGPVWAAAPDGIKVDRLYRTSEYVTVVMRVTNPSAQRAGAIRVACDVFAADGSALGVAHAKLESVAGGATAVGEAVGNMPPATIDPASAECRIVEGY